MSPPTSLQLGLDSIVALSVVQAARRRGVALRARLMLECGTIRELAAAIDSESVADHRADDDGDGPIPLLANVHWLYEYGDPRRLAQTEAIRLPDGITVDHLHTLLRTVVDGHEMLRCRLDRDTMTFVPGAVEDFLTEVSVTGDLADAVAEAPARRVERLDPQRGALLSTRCGCATTHHRPACWCCTAHVLAMDPASWRIVLGELDAGWHALAAGSAADTGARAHQLPAVVAAAARARRTARHAATSGRPSWTAKTPISVRGGSTRRTDRAGDVTVERLRRPTPPTPRGCSARRPADGRICWRPPRRRQSPGGAVIADRTRRRRCWRWSRSAGPTRSSTAAPAMSTPARRSA